MTVSPFKGVTVAKKKAAKKAVKKSNASKAKAPAKAKPAKKAAAPKKAAAKGGSKTASPKKVAKPAAKKLATKAAPKSAPRQMSAKATAKTAGKAAAAPAASMTKSRVGQPLEKLFIPLDDRLIVESEAEATRTAGGLYIPDTVGGAEGPKRGKVVAVGRGHRDKKGRIRPLDVKLGDTVMFEAYLGAPMKIGDRELVVLRESQLLGVVK